MSKRKIIIPAAIVLIAIVVVAIIVKNPPKGKRGKPAKQSVMSVEVSKLRPQTYQVMLESFGTVKPRTQSVLVAQVSGQINYISSQFRDGGFFEKGDVLLKVDDRDYLAEVKIAESTLISAKQSMLEERARAKQAGVDWQRLGNSNEPSDLVLRKPQLESAKAKMLSAQAQLDKTQLKLERSQIVAPYAGRILQKKVDIGQVISTNSQLADIYATDYVEIRLPIKNNDLALIDLPEEYRNNAVAPQPLAVTFKSDLIGEQSWQGEVVRTEGAIDNNAQQLYIVAQIANPYLSDQSPIKIGQYVTAQIKGKVIDSAMVIPNNAIYQGSFVYVVKDSVLSRKAVDIRWQNAQEAIIASGLEFGQRLVLTSLGQVSSGTLVNVLGQDSKPKRFAGKSKDKRGTQPNNGQSVRKKQNKGESKKENQS
jgi:RND family efflux transporter MFP subunit